MMRMVVVGLVVFQLHSAMMGMGHGKLKPKQSQELSKLRAKLVSNNDDYDNLMIAEYTPLRIPTHAPRFKIIDNQLHTRDSLVGTSKRKKHAYSKTTKHTAIQKIEPKNWRLELPDAIMASKKKEDDVQRLDLQDETRIHGEPGFKNTVRTWRPALNVDTSAEKVGHRNNSSLDSKYDTENDSDMIKATTRSKKAHNIDLPNFNREAFESENIKDTKTPNKKVKNQLPAFNEAIYEVTTLKQNTEVTVLRKNPYYKYTLRTWEPESSEDSVSEKPEYQIAERMDSYDNETETNEGTEYLENSTETENTLRLDTLERKEDKVKKKMDQETLPTKNTEVTKVTSILNKQSDFNTWRTWQHFINSNITATRSPENIKSTNAKTPDYEEYKYWNHPREAHMKIGMKTPPTKYSYTSEKIGAMHWRIGSEESYFEA